MSTRPSITITITLAAAALTGCLYDGKGTAGLPCNVDADCGAQQCTEGICGGPSAAGATGGSSGGSGSSSGDPITKQNLPSPCAAGETQCIDSNSIAICQDGKLLHVQCEAVCGMDNPVEGGCQADPRNGDELCWCANTGGPPSGTCQTACSYDSDCSSGESCLNIVGSGTICMPTQCQGCFDSGLSCFSYPDSCKYDHCE